MTGLSKISGPVGLACNGRHARKQPRGDEIFFGSFTHSRHAEIGGASIVPDAPVGTQDMTHEQPDKSLTLCRKGEQRFVGARRVGNLILGPDNFSVKGYGMMALINSASWSATEVGVPDPSTGAPQNAQYTRYTNHTTAVLFSLATYNLPINGSLVSSVWLRSSSTKTVALYTPSYGQHSVTVTPEWQRFAVPSTYVATAVFGFASSDGFQPGEWIEAGAWMVEHTSSDVPSEFIPRCVPVGGNLLSNGDFSDGGTEWVIGAGSIANGVFTSTAVTTTWLDSTLTATPGAWYRIRFTRGGTSTSAIDVRSGNKLFDGICNGAGEWEMIIRAQNGGPLVRFYADTQVGDITIDNVVVEELDDHGAGVPGVQYFPYACGNTVNNSVVSEADGDDYDARQLKGAMFERTGTNSILYGVAVGAGSWSVGEATKQTLNGINDPATPIGDRTFCKVVPSTSNSLHYLASPTLGILPANKIPAVSFYARSEGYPRAGFDLFEATYVMAGVVDLVTGTVVSAVNCTVLVEEVPCCPGTWKISAVRTSAYVGGTYGQVDLYPLPGTADNVVAPWTGNGTDGVSFWGAHCDLDTNGLGTGSFIPTSTTALTREATLGALDNAGFMSAVGNGGLSGLSVMLDVSQVPVVRSGDLPFACAAINAIDANLALWLGVTNPISFMPLFGAPSPVYDFRAQRVESYCLTKQATQYELTKSVIPGQYVRATTGSIGSASSFDFASDGAGSGGGCAIKNLRFWNKHLSETEVRRLMK